MRTISSFLYFKVFKWKMEGVFPDVDQCVVVVVPHTHWMDFLLGVVVRSILAKEINYIGKRSLFRPPFGWFFRWMGGVPVDRDKNSNTVDSITKVFEARKIFRFAIAPEGTRKKVTELKTGFYHIAKKAKVPMVLVAFDFGKKTVRFSELFYTSDSKESDFEKVKSFYKGVVGKVPEYSF